MRTAAQDRKQQILQAAASLLAREGFQGTAALTKNAALLRQRRAELAGKQ
jgi:AcrR family transcriptional regulator